MEEIARVYARSLFEVAHEAEKLDLVREQLGEFADALEGNHELTVFFFSPYFSTEEKKQGLGRMLDGPDEIVARARKTGEQAEAASIVAAHQKHDELLEQTRREIQVETQRAIQEIRSEVADMTVRATEKVTRKSLTEADQHRLVEEALSELDFAALSGRGDAR